MKFLRKAQALAADLAARFGGQDERFRWSDAAALSADSGEKGSGTCVLIIMCNSHVQSRVHKTLVDDVTRTSEVCMQEMYSLGGWLQCVDHSV